MRRRQTVPERLLIVQDGTDPGIVAVAKRLPLGTGVLLLEPLCASNWRRLRLVARQRKLAIFEEVPGMGARVHNLRELRHALLRGSELILLSPMNRTGSHPDWVPVPRMRAAAIARLGGRRVVALGGMNQKRFAKVAPLGFIGWAGISAFRT
jgi:thiamine-phosphate pyrophosphorylase